jgi:dTDP-4-amino-4,6-dideoxygalactose transaminase
MKVPFSYLDDQFRDLEAYLGDLRAFIPTGDFTLGKPLQEFEQRFAEAVGAPHAVGVASGTDALILALKILGVGPGDEVITTPTTFVATVGAIAMTGARPVFVDSEDGFVIDPDLLERAITPRTRAIVPVHYTGNVADMPRIMEIARRRGLAVVEDACQAIAASLEGTPAGAWGDLGAFSLHPLKNLNVWGDGGMIVTRDRALADRLRLLRNHGLANRDEVVCFGHNSRLDTLQAVIGNRLIREMEAITARRIHNAMRLDEGLAGVSGVTVPRRRPGVRHVFHLYMVRAERRDALLARLQDEGIEAKVHYPIPLHLQEAARHLGHSAGDFPICEADCRRVITLPAHQHLSDEQIDRVIDRVRAFYGS